MPDASPGSSTSLAQPSGPRDVHLALAGALMAVLFAATVLLVDHRWAPLLKADQSARDGLHYYGINRPGFVHTMQVISASGSPLAWVVILTPVVVCLLWRRLPRLAVFVVVAVLGSALLNVVVKTVVHRARPVLTDPVAHAHGLSFPSAHAQGAAVGYVLLLLVVLPLLSRRWRKGAVTFAVVAVLVIGFSRIALGVHYVSDVAGGYFLGVAWVAALAIAFD